jgi:hypothetical protein
VPHVADFSVGSCDCGFSSDRTSERHTLSPLKRIATGFSPSRERQSWTRGKRITGGFSVPRNGPRAFPNDVRPSTDDRGAALDVYALREASLAPTATRATPVEQLPINAYRVSL